MKVRRYNEETKFPVTPSFVLTHSSDSILIIKVTRTLKTNFKSHGYLCQMNAIYSPFT